MIMRFDAFPRSRDRGPIEAVEKFLPAQSGGGFRDHAIAAPLKRISAMEIDPTVFVSAITRSRPH